MILPLDTIIQGNVMDVLRSLPSESVHCVITSPPYWALREYGTIPVVWGGSEKCEHDWGDMERGRRKDLLPGDKTTNDARLGTDNRNGAESMRAAAVDGGRFCKKCRGWKGELGHEPSLGLYVEHMVQIFREVRRILRVDGTLWLNIGDTSSFGKSRSTEDCMKGGARWNNRPSWRRDRAARQDNPKKSAPEVKSKDLCGIPWRVAFALQDDGWYLRSDIIWHKPNPMPESVEDRPVRSHEMVFLMAKSERYFYDRDAIREPLKPKTLTTFGYLRQKLGEEDGKVKAHRFSSTVPMRRPRMNPDGSLAGACKRDVWTVSTNGYKGGHFATFPPKLIEPMILAGTSGGGCCELCGTPLVRLTEKPTYDRISYNGKWAGEDGHKKAHRLSAATHGARKAGHGLGHDNPFPVGKHVGWKRTCACTLSTETKPCVVFDPFMGAGTVAIVAALNGRNYCGSELQAEYIEQARERVVRELRKAEECKIKAMKKLTSQIARKNSETNSSPQDSHNPSQPSKKSKKPRRSARANNPGGLARLPISENLSDVLSRS